MPVLRLSAFDPEATDGKLLRTIGGPATRETIVTIPQVPSLAGGTAVGDVVVGPAGLPSSSDFKDLELQTIVFVAFELKSAFGALTNLFV